MTILHDASNPWLRKGLGLVAQVVGIGQHGDGGDGGIGDEKTQMQAMRSLSSLIHPHLPPNNARVGGVGSSLDGVVLYRSEGKEEREAREAMRLVSLEDQVQVLPADSHAQQQLHTLAPGVAQLQDVHMASGDSGSMGSSGFAQAQYPPPNASIPPAISDPASANISTGSSASIPAAPTLMTRAFSSSTDTSQIPSSAFTPSWAMPSSQAETLVSNLSTSFTAASSADINNSKDVSVLNPENRIPLSSKALAHAAPLITQDFVPLTSGSIEKESADDDDEDDDDDAPIPEIDMRSDSEEDE